MSVSQLRVRASALAAPILLFLYGLLRLIEVTDGNYDHGGLAWDVGHVLFLIAFVLFGVLIISLHELIPSRTRFTQVIACLLVAGGLLGAACFFWGILGDLSPTLHRAAPVPGLLQTIGPLLFQIGILGLLIMLVAARPRRLPIWSPILMFIGFLLFAVKLDLLPAGALIILFGLWPLTRRPAATK